MVSEQCENKPVMTRLTAETRRCQFRQKSVSLNETRPRLMRAMSAPIRPNPPADIPDKVSANTNNPNPTKRRLRRKKIAPVDISTLNLKFPSQQQYANKCGAERSTDERSLTMVKHMMSSRPTKSVKPQKLTAPPRAKSAVGGNEIVTLVSLLSPGASDSEKEDSPNSSNETTHEKTTPSLRKVGKSGKIKIFGNLFTVNNFFCYRGKQCHFRMTTVWVMTIQLLIYHRYYVEHHLYH